MSISRITAKGFKRLDFDQPLKKLNIFTGPNGAGKSARTQALQLARIGYVVEEKPKKANQDIFAAFGNGGPIEVGFEINERHLERRFSLKKETVTQKYRLNGGAWTTTKEEFAGLIASSGDPRILDLQTFMQLSDRKKIETIFELYPPEGDVWKLGSEIEQETEKKNALHQTNRDIERVIQKLTKAKAEIEMPAGTLAETTAEIEKTTKEYKAAQKELKKAEVAEAERVAKEKAEKEAADKAEIVEKETEKETARVKTGLDVRERQIAAAEKRLEKRAASQGIDLHAPSTLESIQQIIDAMTKICGTKCMARALAVKELRKFQGKEAA